MTKALFLLCIAELSARFKEEGMLAYVELIQRKEKEIGCDVLTHQKWFVIPFLSLMKRYILT
jgi:isocitrate lyase